MLNELIKNKVYYKIFDRSDHNLTHKYNIHNFEDQIIIDQAKNDIEKVIQSFDAKNMLFKTNIDVYHQSNLFFLNVFRQTLLLLFQALFP